MTHQCATMLPLQQTTNNLALSKILAASTYLLLPRTCGRIGFVFSNNKTNKPPMHPRTNTEHRQNRRRPLTVQWHMWGPACSSGKNANLFFDKKKNRKLANIRPSLHFYGMIILVKKKGLCIGMTWLPFQKFWVNFVFESPSASYLWMYTCIILCSFDSQWKRSLRCYNNQSIG